MPRTISCHPVLTALLVAGLAIVALPAVAADAGIRLTPEQQALIKATYGATPAGCSALSILAPEPAAGSKELRFPEVTLDAGETLRIGDLVRFTVPSRERSGLAACLEMADLTLFIDGLPVTGVAPVRRDAGTAGTATIWYRIVRPSGDLRAWNELMLRGWQAGDDRAVKVGLGNATVEFARAAREVPIRLGAGGRHFGWAGLALGLLLLALLWGSSNLLADRRPGPLSYSVSRLLMACWTLTTLAAVVLHYLHTGEMPSSKDGALAFMLALGGTATGATALMDNLKKTANSAPSTLSDDLLRDADGLAVHRVQVVLVHAVALFAVWRGLVLTGVPAVIDVGWATALGASTLAYLFGRWSESPAPTVGVARA